MFCLFTYYLVLDFNGKPTTYHCSLQSSSPLSEIHGLGHWNCVISEKHNFMFYHLYISPVIPAQNKTCSYMRLNHASGS